MYMSQRLSGTQPKTPWMKGKVEDDKKKRMGRDEDPERWDIWRYVDLNKVERFVFM